MLPPFPIQSEETRAMAKHCTVGIEPRISSERIILLDTQVLYLASYNFDLGVNLAMTCSLAKSRKLEGPKYCTWMPKRQNNNITDGHKVVWTLLYFIYSS